MTRRTDVAIVGGGVAGLAAARDLAGSGLSIVVLEARPRLGGRVKTRRRSESAVPVELGAEFIHGDAPETMRIVRSAPLLAVRIPDVHWRWTPRGVTDADFWQPIVRVLSRVPRSGRDVSAGAFLRSREARAGGGQRVLVRSFVEGYHAAALDDVSARSIAMEPEDAGFADAQFRILDGQDRVVQWLRAGADPAAIEWRTECPVTRIEWSERGGARLTDAAGRRVRAKSVIVTVPVGVLQADGGPGAIAFSPRLPPAKRRAIGQLAMGSVVKVVFRFREAFWEREGLLAPRRNGKARKDDDLVFLHAADAPFPTWWTSAPARSTLLTAWAGGPAADRLRAGKVPPEEIALDTLSRLAGIPRRALDGLVASFDTHDWSADPFARGAYSHARPGGAGAARGLARPVGRVLFFAGEATSPDESGTVAGAIASGRRAAREVLAARGETSR